MSLISSKNGEIVARLRAYGDKAAVITVDRQISYAQLAAQVEYLSCEITVGGTGLGDHFGVYGERSLFNVVCLLAILNVGGVYVPVNMDTPLHRKRLYLERAHLKYLLCSQAHQIDSALKPGLATLTVDIPATVSSGERIFRKTKLIPETAGAYIIFTSGTTGTPKPVVISRMALGKHNSAVAALYDIHQDDVVLHTCANTFDISIEEILPTLAVGATLYIWSRSEQQSCGSLQRVIRERNISIVNIPTAMWGAWINELRAGHLSVPDCLRTVIIGGEACPPAYLQKWNEVNKTGVRCINAYGPTETTITATTWEASGLNSDAMISAQDRYVPVGIPLKGTAVYVLDRQARPVPQGIAGELYIGGAQVGMGYLELPAETAGKFIPDPFSDESGARMYKTGDLAYMKETGDVVVTGRRDRQVKINGYRIELPEIESVLNCHPQIDLVTVAVKRIRGTVKLVAYIKLKDTPRHLVGRYLYWDDVEIAKCLFTCVAERLPSYMVPDYFLILDQVPITINGKIDVEALVDIPYVNMQASPEMEGELFHRDPEVVDAVKHCLSEELQNIKSSFLALGGDSVKAMMLSSMLSSLGYKVSVATILSSTSLYETLMPLTRNKAAHRGTAENRTGKGLKTYGLPSHVVSAFNPEQNSNIEFIALCSEVQGRMLYHSKSEPASGVLIDQVEGELIDLDKGKFINAWQHVMDRHSNLRCKFDLSINSYPIQVAYKSLTVDEFTEIDFRHLEKGLKVISIKEFLRKDRLRGFNPSEVPLFRITLLRTTENSWHFVWTYHHAILDGWSDVMVLDEVFEAYQCLLDAKKVELPTVGKYENYLVWLSEQDREMSACYWKTCVQSVHDDRYLIGFGDQPVDEKCSRIMLGNETSNALVALGKEYGVTLSTIFNGIAGRIIMGLSGTTSCLIGNVVATRPQDVDGIDRIVGPLINIVPVKIEVNELNSTRDWLRSLFQNHLNSSAHTYLPYSLILKQASHLNPKVLFDTLLVMENYPDPRSGDIKKLRSHTSIGYPLAIIVWPGDCIEIEIKWKTDNLDSTAIGMITDRIWSEISSLTAEARSTPPISQICRSLV